MDTLDKLDFARLQRLASASQGAMSQGRISADFTINGASLLQMLANIGAGHDDFMGCFVKGYEDHNRQQVKLLLGVASTDFEDQRILLYVCPECGDIGCGAFAAKVEVHPTEVVWSDFAYVNGYEPASPLAGIGPFHFQRSSYTDVIASASAF